MKQRLRGVIRRLLPPVVVALARRIRPEWRYAGASAPAIKSSDWQHPSIADTQVRKWPRWLEMTASSGPLGIAFEAPVLTADNIAAHNLALTFGYVLGVAARGRETIAILDWGGGIGHYHALARTLFPDLSLSYTVADLAPAIAAGRTVNPDVRFLDAGQPLPTEGYDLVFASGSIQYSADWMDLVRTLARHAQAYLFLTRLPVVNSAPSFVAAQRAHRYGYATEYRGWCLNRHELLATVSGAGGRLLREFVADELPYLMGAPEQPVSAGFLFHVDGAHAWGSFSRCAPCLAVPPLVCNGR